MMIMFGGWNFPIEIEIPNYKHKRTKKKKTDLVLHSKLLMTSL